IKKIIAENGFSCMEVYVFSKAAAGIADRYIVLSFPFYLQPRLCPFYLIEASAVAIAFSNKAVILQQSYVDDKILRKRRQVGIPGMPYHLRCTRRQGYTQAVCKIFFTIHHVQHLYPQHSAAGIRPVIDAENHAG